jgi:hypothetical protein
MALETDGKHHHFVALEQKLGELTHTVAPPTCREDDLRIT